MKKLFYVRHGETEMNVAKLWSGQVETPLTETGKEQAKSAGKLLKDNHPPIDIIVCSPLSRARHTAELIANEIEYPIDKIVSNELFVERGFGKLEGITTDGYGITYNFEDLEQIHGSETVTEVGERARKALEFVESLPEDNVLVVSHGTFGRAFRRAVHNLPHDHEYDSAHRDKFRLANAEIVELI